MTAIGIPRGLSARLLAGLLASACGAWAVLGAAAEPVSSGLSVDQAIELYSQGKHGEAAAILETLAVSMRDSKEVFVWLGRCRLKMGKYDQAREAYQRLMELAPEDPEGPVTTARTYRTQGNGPMAELWYRRAIAMDPSNAMWKEELASVQRGDKAPAPEPEPPVPTPAPAPAPAAAPAPQEEEKGFWRQGVAGLCGARGSVLARIVALVIFAFMTLGGVVQSGIALAKIYGKNAPGMVLLGSWLGIGFLYVVYWGWPSGGQWALAIPYVVLSTIITAGVAAAPQQ